MRIIAGIAKGRRLSAPKSPLIRPAADKVKGALFNILGSMEGCSVLDLFAGTGSVGLEAASRRAEFVTFVDSRADAIKLIRENISKCGFTENTSILRGTIPSILSKIPKNLIPFDVIFVDPPYDKGLILPALTAIHKNKLIDAESKIIIEHSPREKPECEGLAVTDTRKYGQTLISFLKISS